MDEVQIAPQLEKPLQFEILRVPYLLESNYDENESWEEKHLERMQRNFSSASSYGNDGYQNCEYISLQVTKIDTFDDLSLLLLL